VLINICCVSTEEIALSIPVCRQFGVYEFHINALQLELRFFTRLLKEGTADIFVRPAETVTSNKQLTIYDSKFSKISEPTQSEIATAVKLDNVQTQNFLTSM